MLDAILVALRGSPAGLNDTSLFWELKAGEFPAITREEFGAAVTYAIATQRIYFGENRRYYIDRSYKRNERFT